MKLKDKVAVVTGASRGIGRASAVLFAREGARVTLADNRSELGEETARLIWEQGGQAHLCSTDVAVHGQVKSMLDDTVARWGKLDILFNSAATVLVKFLEDTEESEWDRLMAVNLKSIFHGVKYAVGHMRRQGGGVILNTGSISSFSGQFKTPAYVASKAAIMVLTKSLALDYAADGIRVNCLCPGITDTPALREHMESSGDLNQVIQERTARVPLGRFLTPEEIARAALYLVSEDSQGITGIAHVVDGGLTAGVEFSSDWRTKQVS